MNIRDIWFAAGFQTFYRNILIKQINRFCIFFSYRIINNPYWIILHYIILIKRSQELVKSLNIWIDHFLITMRNDFFNKTKKMVNSVFFLIFFNEKLKFLVKKQLKIIWEIFSVTIAIFETVNATRSVRLEKALDLLPFWK